LKETDRAPAWFRSLMGTPPLLWLTIFLGIPLLLVVAISFTTRGTYGGVVYQFSLASYAMLLDPLYVGIMVRSLGMATVATLVCLLAGYPLAAYIAAAGPERRRWLLMLVIIPFCINFLIRTYAWMVLLRSEGLINSLLMATGLIESPLAMLYTPGAVLLGLVYIFLPFAVLPIYASLEKLDPHLVEAASDLGARGGQVLRRVVLPMAAPGIAAGALLTFIPSLGMFVVTDLMGGSRTMLVGNLIQNQFMAARNWQLGSAASVLLILMVLVGLGIYRRLFPAEGGMGDV